MRDAQKINCFKVKIWNNFNEDNIIDIMNVKYIPRVQKLILEVIYPAIVWAVAFL